MNKLSIATVCAGVFYAAALGSVQGATCPVAGVNGGVIVAALQAWINNHSGPGHQLGATLGNGNWSWEVRGNYSKDEPRFRDHLLEHHESRAKNLDRDGKFINFTKGAPTLKGNWYLDEALDEELLYEAKTQFDGGESLKAVDEFFNNVRDGNVNFNARIKRDNNGNIRLDGYGNPIWEVTATLKKGVPSLNYQVYSPVSLAGYENINILNEFDAARCVPEWGVEYFRALRFDFYTDNTNRVNYKLSTIYPFYTITSYSGDVSDHSTDLRECTYEDHNRYYDDMYYQAKLTVSPSVFFLDDED